MAAKHPYDTTSDALNHPARNAVFFEDWVPEIDNQNDDLLCAEMSRLAYASRDVVKSALTVIGFKEIEFFGGESPKEPAWLGGTQGFVARRSSGGPAVLAFRGTESDKFEDLLSDGEIFQRSSPHFPGCQIHGGFAKLWDRARVGVLDLIARRKGPLLITGHSLGAALATLAVAEALPTESAQDRDERPLTLITFGSPRVGDEKLCARIPADRSRRYVNCCDLIARIPPERLDEGCLSQLLTELVRPERVAPLPLRSLLMLAIKGAAEAIAFVFRRVGAASNFYHLAVEIYGDRNGRLQPGLSAEDILRDQAEARQAYGEPSSPAAFERMGERLEALPAIRAARNPREAIRMLRSFLADLFSRPAKTVPLRDLADHAPINYVSLFTGRT